MNFEQQSFTIKQFDFNKQETVEETVQGFIAEGTGLGYFPVLNDTNIGFSVTHLSSGYDIGYRVYCESDVRQWIEALTALWDWQQMTAKELFALPREEKDKVWKVLVEITDDFLHIKKVMSKDRADSLLVQAKQLAGAN